MSEATICPDCHGHPVTYCNGCGKTAGRGVMDLHSRIINLPAVNADHYDGAERIAYRAGHLDARSAAALIAAFAQSERIARLEEALRLIEQQEIDGYKARLIARAALESK